MHGIVNKAMEDMVVHLRGPATWDSIKRLAGIELESFVDSRSYDDAVTDRLVVAAARLFSLEVDEVLEAFGEYWMLYTAEKGFDELLRGAGSDLFEVLHNTDAMHGRLEHTFPAALMPRIAIERIDAETATLQYRSERPGLAPMLVGIVKGLGARFGTPVRIERLAGVEDGAAVQRFRVSLAS